MRPASERPANEMIRRRPTLETCEREPFAAPASRGPCARGHRLVIGRPERSTNGRGARGLADRQRAAILISEMHARDAGDRSHRRAIFVSGLAALHQQCGCVARCDLPAVCVARWFD